ncbi:RES family NAD+ phosphorylase [Pandoraea sputorum]|uniref:RES family NAD+ phosphorylase n=1 Tax=Pandoraea sputorum TaxID=93222 RepID=UPI002F416D68
MPTEDNVRKSLPSYLRAIVPTQAQIHRALGRQQNSFSADTTFIRAIDNPSFVGSASPFVSHRFGPPVPEFLTEENRLTFTWLYLALSENVAVWESQFAKNNRGAGNGFHIARKAEDSGLIASIRFERSLKLWSLTDDHSSRLGIHDIVSSEDHEACQWLGCAIRDAMLMLDPSDRPDGFIYPSRRVKGATAIALSDWSTTGLFETASVSLVRFVDSIAYSVFASDPMRTSPPALDFD